MRNMMTDRESQERLVELIVDAVGGCAKHWAEIIADHLLANGVILMPCKVEDTVYGVFNVDEEGFVDKGTVFAVSKDRGASWISVIYESGLRYYHRAEAIGKTVFLTKEEAEKALAERSKEQWLNT